MVTKDTIGIRCTAQLAAGSIGQKHIAQGAFRAHVRGFTLHTIINLAFSLFHDVGRTPRDTEGSSGGRVGAQGTKGISYACKAVLELTDTYSLVNLIPVDTLTTLTIAIASDTVGGT